MRPFAIPVVALGPGSQPADAAGGPQCAPLPLLETFSAARLEAPSDAAAAVAAADIVTVLREAMERPLPATSVDLLRLAPAVVEALNQALGQGDVSIVIDAAPPALPLRWRIQETAYAGLWRVRGFDAAERMIEDSLETGGIPSVAWAAAEGRDGDCPLRELAPGLMNAPSLLNELRHRARSHRRDDPPYAVNLTLLPMLPQDLQAIDETLGRGPMTMLSRGFGNCRVTATRWRRVWRVQYFNSMETLILDTIEVAAMPQAAQAAPEDIADCAERLGELADWLRQS